MNLFIDTSNWNLILILEKDGEIIDIQTKENTKKVSDILMDNLKDLLSRNNTNIKEIKSIYVTTGPGSYTGVRVGLTFAKTLKTISNNYELYAINSLQFQAGNDKVISLLDARGNKSFYGVYEQGKVIAEESIIENDKVNEIEQKYEGFKVIKDYEGIDFKKNFLELKPNFTKIENEEMLKPIYLKNFI